MAEKRLAKKAARARDTSSRTLSKKPAAIENKHTRERGHSITYELRPTLCGKPGCHKYHGPYWYAYWTQGGRVRTAYIGRKFQRVESKAPGLLGPAQI